jgi:hypothetical protein
MNNFSEIAPFLASSTAETDYLKEKRLLAEANARIAEANARIAEANPLTAAENARAAAENARAAEANARAAEAGMSIEKINALSKLREIRVVS